MPINNKLWPTFGKQLTVRQFKNSSRAKSKLFSCIPVLKFPCEGKLNLAHNVFAHLNWLLGFNLTRSCWLYSPQLKFIPGAPPDSHAPKSMMTSTVDAGLRSIMISHGFKSSKQDFTFGPWKVTAAKNHIMKSKDVERVASEHPQEVARPYDWTFTTDYRGTLIGEEMQLKVAETTERINLEKLRAREQIVFFDEVLLFEDELHDHGVSMISVKIRVMPTSFFTLLRFFLRVDGVLIRINDTRLYHEAGQKYMLREFCTRESNIAELKSVPPSLYTDPNEIAQHLTFKLRECEKLEFPEQEPANDDLK
ncbi:TIP41-like protein isoform X3 [Hippocampus comes]|uniref:TIP41-like protein isoform X3 n=1 Tax=Hippocampus comes TaxID=109280 RepID=UPI00094E758C|nr:PREDICTED: TIP41-like protein isoform X3 [Hippocampus comes]